MRGRRGEKSAALRQLQRLAVGRQHVSDSNERHQRRRDVAQFGVVHVAASEPASRDGMGGAGDEVGLAFFHAADELVLGPLQHGAQNVLFGGLQEVTLQQRRHVFFGKFNERGRRRSVGHGGEFFA